MFRVKENAPKINEVEVKNTDNGVRFVVNGYTIARLDDDDPRLILVGGVSTTITGLSTSAGRVYPIWDTDKINSKGYHIKNHIND